MNDPRPDYVVVREACKAFLSEEAINQTVLSRSHNSVVHGVRLSNQSTVVVKARYGLVQWRAEKEARFIAAVNESGVLRAAALLGSGTLPAYDATAVITSALRGRTLADQVVIGQKSGAKARSLIGILLSKFHELKMPPMVVDAQRWFERLENPAIALANLTTRQDAALRRATFSTLADQLGRFFSRLIEMGRLELDWVWCHGDLHPYNVVMCSDGGDSSPYLLDFESSVQCIPEYDIAKSIVTSSALRRSDADEVICGLDANRFTSRELIDALIVFHTVDGWLHAAQLERRDRQLWSERLNYVLGNYSSVL